MPEFSVPTSKRRGRPPGKSDTRARIIAAATAEFGDLGYEQATTRGIAARAGVDPAMLHHYFGTKADLFTTVVGLPLRPDVDLPSLLDGDRSELGARVVRYLLEQWEKPEVRKRGTVLLRTAISNRMAAPLLTGFLSRELLDRIVSRLDVPDAELRAGLVASQIGGLIVTRYLLQLQPMATADVEELIDRIGPTIQRYLFD